MEKLLVAVLLFLNMFYSAFAIQYAWGTHLTPWLGVVPSLYIIFLFRVFFSILLPGTRCVQAILGLQSPETINDPKYGETVFLMAFASATVVILLTYIGTFF